MTKIILPVAMGVMSIAASAVYFTHGDWRQGLYWACAAGITVAVTL